MLEHLLILTMNKKVCGIQLTSWTFKTVELLKFQQFSKQNYYKKDMFTKIAIKANALKIPYTGCVFSYIAIVWFTFTKIIVMLVRKYKLPKGRLEEDNYNLCSQEHPLYYLLSI